MCNTRPTKQTLIFKTANIDFFCDVLYTKPLNGFSSSHEIPRNEYNSFSKTSLLKMRGIGVFYKKVKQLLLTNKDLVERYVDHMTVMAVAGVCYPIYTIVRMHTKTEDKSPLAKQKYVLIGDKTITEKVEQEIRRKLGDPVKPSYLMRWRYTEIEKIESEEQIKKLKNEEKPITLYLCTSSKTDLTSKDVFLPSKPKDLPSSITKKNIIVVQRAEDNVDTVNKCVTSLDARTDIKAIFDNTPVLLFTPETNKDMDIQYELALITISVYILAAFIFIIKKLK